MILNLTDVFLDGKRIDSEVPVGFDRLDFSSGSFPVTEKSPVTISIVKNEEEHLEIRGKASITVTVPCDRCLDGVSVPLELEFEEIVPAGGKEGPDEARRGPEDDDDSDESAFEPDYYLEGYNLDVDKLLFGEALLNWPSRVLCKEDCRGLCPVCGQNLNHGDCGCERKALDPRMAKVLDVFSKFKEV